MAALDDRPELLPGLDLVEESFWIVSADRQTGMGVGPIPSVAVHSYLTRVLEITDSDELAEYTELIRRMDAAFLKHHHRKMST